MRRLARPTPFLAASLFMGLAGPAAAHAILIDSSPAPLAHVPAGHLDATLRYNSRIDAGRSKLTLVHDDNQQRLAADDGGRPDLLHAALDLLPGQYTIKWQVLATDGHITHGTLPFTVDPSPQGSAGSAR